MDPIEMFCIGYVLSCVICSMSKPRSLTYNDQKSPLQQELGNRFKMPLKGRIWVVADRCWWREQFRDTEGVNIYLISTVLMRQQIWFYSIKNYLFCTFTGCKFHIGIAQTIVLQPLMISLNYWTIDNITSTIIYTFKYLWPTYKNKGIAF